MTSVPISHVLRSAMNVTMSNSTSGTGSAPATPGVAGRINYAQWDKVARELVEEVEQEDRAETQQEKVMLGLDGKYARSQAEAEERKKAEDVKKVKKTLDRYKKRDMQLVESFTELLGPVDRSEEAKATESTAVRITRDRMGAGKRVISITDTSGHSQSDTIVLTQDLSNLESKMKAHAMTPKTYADDAENDVKEEPKDRNIYGIIKAFIGNVHNCTIIIKCKLISGTIEVHNCSNVTIRVESEGTVATVQADLSENLTIEFRDAPSGKNVALPGQKKMYWGEDADDRIFHAGIKNLCVRIVRDEYVDMEVNSDYLKDGAVSVGNATPEEFQFVTSVVNGELVTEKVVRAGSTTGKNARAMTQRELDKEKDLREKTAAMALNMAEDMIQIKDKHGNPLAKRESTISVEPMDDDVEEVLSAEIKDVLEECEQNKARGNEAFGTGEYGQAILLYSLALDKAAELPDQDNKLFARDIVYSNRSACFLKLGQHEKAEEDARRALELNPNNLKAVFRRGLALHAMGRYFDALPVLAEAHKLEPNNKQIKQALQFCEVRVEQEHRKRMQG